jgi:hypothetical protein
MRLEQERRLKVFPPSSTIAIDDDEEHFSKTSYIIRTKLVNPPIFAGIYTYYTDTRNYEDSPKESIQQEVNEN